MRSTQGHWNTDTGSFTESIDGPPTTVTWIITDAITSVFGGALNYLLSSASGRSLLYPVLHRHQRRLLLDSSPPPSLPCNLIPSALVVLCFPLTHEYNEPHIEGEDHAYSSADGQTVVSFKLLQCTQTLMGFVLPPVTHCDIMISVI